MPNSQTSPKSDLNLSLDNSAPQGLTITPADTLAPAITISSPQAGDYTRAEMLSIDVTIIDAGTGVFSQEITLDDTVIIESGDSIDLFFQNLGNHKLQAHAADYVGNTSDQGVNFRIIATLESTIAGIQRAYSLGWIDEAGIRDSLIVKLRTDKIQAKAFLNELDAQKDKHINDQAYQLLSEDINWLISN